MNRKRLRKILGEDFEIREQTYRFIRDQDEYKLVEASA